MSGNDQNPSPAERPDGGKLSPPQGGTSDNSLFGPTGVAQRIQAAAHGAIASLPRTLRERASHLWNAPNLKRLTDAMALWVRGAELETEQFAHLFFGRASHDPGATLLHDAALNVSSATDHIQLSGGAQKIAEALQVIGVDRWSVFLAEVRDRALDPATVAAVEHSRDGAPDLDPQAGEALVGRVSAEPSAADGMNPSGQDSGPETGTPEQLPRPGQAGGGARPLAWPLPPRGVTPPVRNPNRLIAQNASRPSESSSGGKSLWDENGGEWRYYPVGTWNRSSWDYNEHAAPNSPWRNIPSGGPARTAQ